jgi:hypothetical protein
LEGEQNFLGSTPEVALRATLQLLAAEEALALFGWQISWGVTSWWTHCCRLPSPYQIFSLNSKSKLW